MKNRQRIMWCVLSSILIFLFSLVGCSDPSHTGGSLASHTGSMLTASDIDDYLTSFRGGRYCIHNEAESSCIDLISLLDGDVDTQGPIIHIYPERTVYLFYHEGKPIVRAERRSDTTDLIDTLRDPQKDGNNDNNNGDPNADTHAPDDNTDNTDNTDDGDGTHDDDDTADNDDNTDNTDPTDNMRDGHGWLIWIYYPEGTAPKNPPTLSASQVTVIINGKQLTDADITGFAQFIGSEDERGIQFFYPTESAELLDLQVQMVGITDQDGNVRFNINYLWRSY